MSLGALSPEAHEALAIAMNNLEEDLTLEKEENILIGITLKNHPKLSKLLREDLE